MVNRARVVIVFTLCFLFGSSAGLCAQEERDQILRVFVFAGQSNMVGSDSRVKDIRRFPPFAGLEAPQGEVKFWYDIGREHRNRSQGWVDLQPVSGVVGPELSFAREVTRTTRAPIAIVKCAAGGTHLGGDWNPDQPSGFKMYPRALELVRTSLAKLDEQGVEYRLEGFMWHQGENDMFEEDYMAHYGENLKNFLAKWRRDLKSPELRFYVGELCTKTIWGMDLRPRMYAISQGQKSVTESDPRAQYVPTSHVGVEIGDGVGLHYHYGTLGQLEHGVNYAHAYLRSVGEANEEPRPLKAWPYPKGSKVRLFVLAGHRNMEGERAFVEELEALRSKSSLIEDDHRVAYKYSVGGGYKKSEGWEPLGPAGPYETFGPELSFARAIRSELTGNYAIAKFTHSGSQIIDWTPEGSMARTRNLYSDFIDFVRESIEELASKGHEVEFEGIFYHLGENDMSFGPYRERAVERLQSIVSQSRMDLARPSLKWFVSQQPPTDHEQVNGIDVTTALATAAEADSNLVHVSAFSLPKQPQQIVITTEGIVRLGEIIAQSYVEHR